MQHFNDTHCVLSFLVVYPRNVKKHGIEETFAGCFLSKSLSPLNASFCLRGTFQLQALFVFPIVTARKAWNFLRFHLLTGQSHLFSQQCILLSKKFFTPILITYWSIQRTRGRQKCWDVGRSRGEVHLCRIPRTLCRPDVGCWPRPGGRRSWFRGLQDDEQELRCWHRGFQKVTRWREAYEWGQGWSRKSSCAFN